MAERKKFARQPVEPRGEQPNEIRMQKAFWRKYSMDLIIQQITCKPYVQIATDLKLR